LTAARRLVVVLLAGLWLLVSGTAAQAHAVLRSSDPADGVSLDRAPRQVTLTFTERPEPRLSTVQVLDAEGRPVQAGKAGPVPGQPFQLQVPLGALPDGTYTVAWRTVSRDDGHVSGGSFAFGVGVAAPAAGAQGAAAPATSTPPPTPLATAGRWLLYCGLALLVGAAATGLVVYDRQLPAGARPLLVVGAGLAVVGLVARVAAERPPSGCRWLTWSPPTLAGTWPGWPLGSWPAPRPLGCWPPGSGNSTARTGRLWQMTSKPVQVMESPWVGWPRSD
jgi:methionine-rich copper-binding protein CopC